MGAYRDFLARKAVTDPATGFEPEDMPAAMFPFQADIVRWALRRGRAALFAGTGLGKSFMELAWADAVHRHTGRNILHLAPLAVSAQLADEAVKWGMEARQVSTQAACLSGDNITNYQKLEHFNPEDFGGVILDESSILKSYDGHYRSRLIEACARVPFRLAATATPAPNDFMELGNHAEFLGVMSYTDMLATFFVHDGGDVRSWRLKGHAENDFWRWLASWAVMLRKPSDLGYADDGYNLPPLVWHEHKVPSRDEDAWAAGSLWVSEAATLSERLTARRETVAERVRLAAAITPKDEPFVWWCRLNAESEMLASLIPDCVEVRGSDSEDQKEAKLRDFASGGARGLVTKTSIAGWGMHWPHCAWTGYVGLDDSWEALFQSVRRFWRFGQTRPVHAHMIIAERQGAVVANLKRKDTDADRMAAAMVRHMADLSSLAMRGQVRDRPDYAPKQKMKVPAWLAA